MDTSINHGDEIALVLLFLAWLFYRAFRPVKDFYVLRCAHFESLETHPWRGHQTAANYHAFTEYAPAKVVFERYENLFMWIYDDPGSPETENTLMLVPARSKASAVTKLKSGKATETELLHQTTNSTITKQREEREKLRKEIRFRREKAT